MDFVLWIQMILRRWYVAVPLILLTLVGGYFVLRSTEPTYETRASMLLFYPRSQLTPEQSSQNPYLGFGNLQVIANLVGQVTEQHEARETVAETGGGRASYDVGADTMTNAPILGVVVSGERDHVMPTAVAVLDEVQHQLRRLQEEAGAPEDTWISASVLIAPTRLVPLRGSQYRALVAVLVLGGALTLGATLVTESIAGRGSRAVPSGRQGIDSMGTWVTELQPPVVDGESSRAGPAVGVHDEISSHVVRQPAR